MAKSAASREQTKLSDDISKENNPTSDVVEHLQRQVANAFVLYANYKHYHWQTFGPLFRDLHLMFDEFAQAVLATVDDFAERLRMIGQDPIFRPDEIENDCDRAGVERSDDDARDGRGSGFKSPHRHQGDARCCSRRRRTRRPRHRRSLFATRADSRKARMVAARHPRKERRTYELNRQTVRRSGVRVHLLCS